MPQHHEIAECYGSGFAPGFISADKGGVVRIAELQSQGYLYLRP
jgi:intracellular sulfur oxidation DsrE/DsrF family protein